MKIVAWTGSAIDTVRREGTLGKQLWGTAVVRSATMTGLLLAAVTAALVFSPAASAAVPTLTIDPVVESELPETIISGTAGPYEANPSPAEIVAETRVAGSSEAWERGNSKKFLYTSSEPTPFTVRTTELKSGTKYEVRLKAFNPDTQETADSPEPNPTFETEVVVLPTVSMESPSEITAHSVHLAGHINPNAPAGEHPGYNVLWQFVCSPNCERQFGSIAADSADHLVEEDVTGLQPATTYEVSLRAQNSAGQVVTPQPPFTFTTPAAPPQIVKQKYSGVAEDQATLTATVIPGGAETTYHFDYIPAANLEAEGWASPAVISTPAAGPLMADNAEHEVSTTVTGLTPGIRYGWRLVAENSVEPVESGVAFFTTTVSPVVAAAGCPNEVFRLGPGSLLPDCRAYELASPADKNGDAVEGFAGFFRTPPDGGAVTFYDASGTTIPSPTGAAQTFSTYLASRGSENWTTQRLAVPQSYADSQYTAWLGSTSNLRYAIVQGVRVGVGNGLFAIDTQSGSIATIVPWEENPQLSVNVPRFVYAFDGANDDGSRIFFETEAALTEEATEGVDNLYMWSRSTGQVVLVGLLPNAEGGLEPELGAFGGAYEWFNSEQTGRGGGLDGLAVEADHAISGDGSQIYFTGAGTGQLYLRRGLAGPTPTTVRVSEPAPGAPSEPALPAAFQEATPSGSRAFFLSSQKLTSDATTGTSDEGKDLYRWDAASGELVDVTPDPEDPAGADVQGLLGASADGSSGYFVAKGVLAEGAAGGSSNLYRFAESGSGFKITFIATLNVGSTTGADRRNWSPRTYRENHTGEPTEFKTSRVTPDGKTLLFSSTASVTGYDNTNPAPGIECTDSTEACAEIYLYSAVSGRVNCVSCDPSGAPPQGSAHLQGKFLLTFMTQEFPPNVQIPRNLSSSGDRVFFQTPDPLVSRDGNGTSGCPTTNLGTSGGHENEADFECNDVYEWEAPGAPGGTCHKAEANGGCLYLLSTGQSGVASYFADASEDGSEAFVITASALVPADRDSVYDIYDVHGDGGLASQWASPGLSCEGEACLGPPAPAPATANPSSSRFEGAGNLKHKRKHHKKKPKGHKKRHKRHPVKKHKGKARQLKHRAVDATRKGGSK